MSWLMLGRMDLAQLASIASPRVLTTRVLDRAMLIKGVPTAVLAVDDKRALVSRLVSWGAYTGTFMFVSYPTLKLHNPRGDVAGLLVAYKGGVWVLEGTRVVLAA